jgi:putative beta-lysine N-acetyltransferase
MMFDKIETISKSLVQHGPNNDRVYLMKIHEEENVENLVGRLHNLAILKRYTKIFIKVPERISHLFLDRDFKLEAIVPNFYLGVEQGCFLGKYMDGSRGYLTENEKTLINEVKYSATLTHDISDLELPAGYEIVKLAEKDVPAIAKIYKQVFQFYPFPIFQEEYLLDTIQSNVQYFGVQHQGELIAVSAAEMDIASCNVEMTDFATLPGYRGKNLSYHLLTRMMMQMSVEGIQTAYTIARANSHGMNKTFARQGFHFGGTLVNNTLIGDTIESMNVWHRDL